MRGPRSLEPLRGKGRGAGRGPTRPLRDDPQRVLRQALGFDPATLRDAAERPDDPEPAALAGAAQVLISSRERPPETEDTELLIRQLAERLCLDTAPAETPGVRAGPAAAGEAAAWEVPAAARAGGSLPALVHLLDLLAPQVHWLRPAFWLATAVVLAGGLLASAFWGAGGITPVLFLVAAAPLLTALGICYAFYDSDPRLQELQATFAITREQVIWGRTLLVVGYDVAMALAASAALWLAAGGDTYFWPLVTTWLAPLLALAAVALWGTLRLGPWQGTGLSTALWCLLLAAERHGGTTWFAIPADPAAAWRRAALAAAAGLVLALALRGAVADSAEPDGSALP